MEDEIQSCVSAPTIGKRHLQVLLQMFFYIIPFAIRTSLTVTFINITSGMLIPPTDISIISNVGSMYLYGFIISASFSGWICNKFGSKWPMIGLMSILSIFTINLPIMSRVYGFNGLMICRFVQGLCTGLGFTMPSDFVSKWVPFQERTVIGTTIYASGLVGDVVGVLGSSYLSSVFGWQFVYTQFGFLAIAWAVLMAVFGANTPEEFSNHMSVSELNYILENRGSVKASPFDDIPWGQMFSSLSFWAIIIAQIGASWLLCILSLNIPVFMIRSFQFRDILVTPNILILISLILSLVFVGIVQRLQNQEKITVEQTRKILNSIGSFVPAFLLVLLIFLTGVPLEGYVIYVILFVSSIGTIAGSRLNINDISPNFAPIIFGISESIGQIFNIVTIQVVKEHIFDNWTFLFVSTAIFLIVTNLIYLKFGSGEEQLWDSYESVLDEEANLSKSSNYVSCDESKYLLFVKK